MNASEKIVAERYELEGYTVIKDGMPDLVAMKDFGDYSEIIFDEVKTGRQPLQKNQKRAMAILKKLEGKPAYITVRRSRVLKKNLQSTPAQVSPSQVNPPRSTSTHSKPRQTTPRQNRPVQTRPRFLWRR